MISQIKRYPEDFIFCKLNLDNVADDRNQFSLFLIL